MLLRRRQMSWFAGSKCPDPRNPEIGSAMCQVASSSPFQQVFPDLGDWDFQLLGFILAFLDRKQMVCPKCTGLWCAGHKSTCLLDFQAALHEDDLDAQLMEDGVHLVQASRVGIREFNSRTPQLAQTYKTFLY